MIHSISQITHCIDHVMIHIEMHFSELVCPLPHHDLLMSHLQTLVLGRRNDDDGSTLRWRTCPCTRTHPCARTGPDARLARILTLHPLLMSHHNTCAIASISLVGSLISHP